MAKAATHTSTSGVSLSNCHGLFGGLSGSGTLLGLMEMRCHTQILRQLSIPAFGFCRVRGAHAFMHVFAVPDNSLDERNVHLPQWMQEFFASGHVKSNGGHKTLNCPSLVLSRLHPFTSDDNDQTKQEQVAELVEVEPVLCAGSPAAPCVDAAAVRRQLWRGGRGYYVSEGCMLAVTCLDGGATQLAVFRVVSCRPSTKPVRVGQKTVVQLVAHAGHALGPSTARPLPPLLPSQLAASRALGELLTAAILSAGFASSAMAPRCVLVCGPSGVGKRTVVHHTVRGLCKTMGIDKAKVRIAVIRPADVRHGFDPSAVVSMAGQRCAVLVVLEHMRLFSSAADWSLPALVAWMLRRPRVVLCGICSATAALTPSLLRPGAFAPCFHVRVGVPSEEDRNQYLAARLDARIGAGICRRLARCSNGYTLDDLRKLITMAMAEHHTGGDDMRHCLVRALDLVAPTAVGQLQFTNNIDERWSDVGGYEAVKTRLRHLVQWQFSAHANLAVGGLKLEPVSGVLLTGPPGCGKTLLARALAGECKVNFAEVKSTELLSKYLGESEHLLRTVFADARAAAPCLLLFDQIDCIGRARDLDGTGSHGGIAERMLATLLSEMDGVNNNQGVVVLGATNCAATVLDAALLRPGRLEQVVNVPLPDAAERALVLAAHTRNIPLDASVRFHILAQRTDGFSGGRLQRLCQEAGYSALREDLLATHVSQRHFFSALTV